MLIDRSPPSAARAAAWAFVGASVAAQTGSLGAVEQPATISDAVTARNVGFIDALPCVDGFVCVRQLPAQLHGVERQSGDDCGPADQEGPEAKKGDNGFFSGAVQLS